VTHSRQAGIKEGTGPYDPCKGDPCSLCWPKKGEKGGGPGCSSPPGVMANITLRNITVIKPQGSAGVIFGNDSRPIVGLVFDGVRVVQPAPDGVWGKAFYFCEGVERGVATGGTWPVPPCFSQRRLDTE
jgi:hypothetical protein